MAAVVLIKNLAFTSPALSTAGKPLRSGEDGDGDGDGDAQRQSGARAGASRDCALRRSRAATSGDRDQRWAARHVERTASGMEDGGASPTGQARRVTDVHNGSGPRWRGRWLSVGVRGPSAASGAGTSWQPARPPLALGQDHRTVGAKGFPGPPDPSEIYGDGRRGGSLWIYPTGTGPAVPENSS